MSVAFEDWGSNASLDDVRGALQDWMEADDEEGIAAALNPIKAREKYK